VVGWRQGVLTDVTRFPTKWLSPRRGGVCELVAPLKELLEPVEGYLILILYTRMRSMRQKAVCPPRRARHGACLAPRHVTLEKPRPHAPGLTDAAKSSIIFPEQQSVAGRVIAHPPATRPAYEEPASGAGAIVSQSAGATTLYSPEQNAAHRPHKTGNKSFSRTSERKKRNVSTRTFFPALMV
jgi:hypothetical protein